MLPIRGSKKLAHKQEYVFKIATASGRMSRGVVRLSVLFRRPVSGRLHFGQVLCALGEGERCDDRESDKKTRLPLLESMPPPPLQMLSYDFFLVADICSRKNAATLCT